MYTNIADYKQSKTNESRQPSLNENTANPAGITMETLFKPALAYKTSEMIDALMDYWTDGYEWIVPGKEDTQVTPEFILANFTQEEGQAYADMMAEDYTDPDVGNLDDAYGDWCFAFYQRLGLMNENNLD